MQTEAVPRQNSSLSPLLEIKSILAPIDFSPASRKAIQCAFEWGELCHAEVTLLHVLEPLTKPDFPDIVSPSSWNSKQTANAEENLRAFVAGPEAKGVKQIKWQVRTGGAAQEIVDTARELDVDLIVIATHGYTGWKHFCIGSTAERVVRVAPCPVLVVREKEHELT